MARPALLPSFLDPNARRGQRRVTGIRGWNLRFHEVSCIPSVRYFFSVLLSSLRYVCLLNLLWLTNMFIPNTQIDIRRSCMAPSQRLGVQDEH
jgi:hypothetical protein